MIGEFIKRILVGLLFGLFGWALLLSANAFVDHSRPAKLIVLQIDRDSGSDGFVYRPVFGLEADVRPRPEYAGNAWTFPPLHRAGDIVDGRYDPATGKMASNRLIAFQQFFGLVGTLIGLYCLVTGVGVLFGIRPWD